MTKKILAIIPARGGSKGVPRKNIRLLGDQPLISYTIKAVTGSGVMDKIIVSTEDQEIAGVARQFGAEVVDRPMELAQDTTLIEPVMRQVLESLAQSGYRPDYVGLFNPTSPFLKPEVIKQGVELLEQGFDACFAAYYPHSYEFKWKKDKDNFQVIPADFPLAYRPRRQDLPQIFHENGAMYLVRTDLFLQTGNRYGGPGAKITLAEMAETDSHQIDSEYDLWLAEKIMVENFTDQEEGR
jgi:CMP-N,N'-diacetyllegionaminic acid synthase